ncbi:ParB N-terminal domain-containing protein [Streptomyces globisporus]|uniref:ParB N-terminal domain-containing protein n=1 Tax=Streptomyces globisporus TaxID=1908 RepID=UPI0037A1D226
MLEYLLTTEVLGFMSSEAFLHSWGDGATVQDSLIVKRADAGYPQLRENIRQHGIRTPALIEVTDSGYRRLLEGHHRVAAAVDLGIETVPVTTDERLYRHIDEMSWLLLSHDDLADDALEPLKAEAAAGLAVGLHDATGWPLIEVGSSEGRGLHYMVRHPSGQVMDAEGLHQEQHVAIDFDYYADSSVTFTEARRDEVLVRYREEFDEPVPMALMPAVATAVLRRYGMARDSHQAAA